MMIDGKGCALILGLLALVGFLIGLVAHWFGAPWFAPLIGLVAGPIVVAAIAGVASLLFLADGMGR